MVADAASSRSEELWLVALALGSVAVVVVAVLFGLMIAVLQRIDRHAARAHAAGKQLAQNTVALWALDQMNRDLVAIRDAARDATRSSGSVVRTGPVAAAAEKVQGWVGGSDQDDDKSSGPQP